ncbi:histidine phosphatase family protein [Pseudonocardia sp. NPDC049635]|uniref:histidine phosphatase family protein n=1 Tax=Pseudonocardia sp. NPDC049635 TaxID=3155506 RepID=UPI0033E28920
MSTHLLLTRHAETEWHAENRYAGGDSDIDLTPNGRVQAERLAGLDRIRPVHAVVCSPVRRAVETATPAARHWGLEIEIEVGLREVSFGSAEGHRLAELEPAVAEAFRSDPVAHPFPGAEDPHAAAARGAATLDAVARRHPERTVLVVAHNTVLRLILCTVLGLPLARYRTLFPRLDNVALCEVVLRPGQPGPASLLGLNIPLPPLFTSASPTASAASTPRRHP